MVLVQDVLDFLNTIAPPYMKMDWDNVGLLFGGKDRQVTRILVALDPFEDVVREAAEQGAELLVTHHPLIFTPPRQITETTALGRTVLLLARHSISAINAHTNLDCAPGGVNDCLARQLDLLGTEVLNPSGTDEQGRSWGLLRAGFTEPQPLSRFLELVKCRLGCPGLRYVSGGREVRHVAVGGGACAGEMDLALAAGCDTFVTADVKYNQFWDARDRGLNLIDAGHFYTENPVCRVLAEQLAAHFPALTVLCSEKHRDCMEFC